MRLIDADALTTALDGYRHHIMLIKKKSRKTEEAILCDVKGIINSVLTIEERKKGKWIDTCDYCGEFMCSNCHETNINNFYKYCPHCGAEMSKEGN